MPLQPFRFLDLPPEIRQKIYTLICTSAPFTPLHEAGAHHCFPSDLLLVNSQIYHEVRPVYFSINAFCVTVRRQNDDWAYFLAPAFQDYRRQVRSLVVTLLRWGTKGFFQETLIPLLEDCILNGNLRSLEFRVSAVWFNSQKSRGRDGRGDYLMSGGTLDAIRKILADPYLESGTLRVGDTGGLLLGSPGYDGDNGLENVTARLFEENAI